MKFFLILISINTIFFNTFLLANEDFTINGTNLIYDTVKGDGNIDWDDNDVLISILQNNEIDQLILNSYGGLVFAAMEMTEVIVDYELNTHVNGVCYSSCYLLFLAGEKRSLNRLSKIGLHRAQWGPDSMRNYYLKWKDDEGFQWKDEFDFSSWAIKDNQKDIHDDFVYQLSRGVKADFIVKTLSAENEEMWVPERKELIQSGVITERIKDYNKRKK